MARKTKPRRPRVHRPRHPDAVNVVQVGVGRNRLGDLYHFFIDSSWPVLLLTISGMFVSGNALFALAYLACGNCIKNAHPGSFLDAFFFSVQTMATIGYGEMIPATVIANLLVLVEVLTGLIGVAMVTGLAFAKFSRPTAKIIFSRVAVMSQRDGHPCLMFRVGNERGNRILEAQFHAVYARIEPTVEGEQLRRASDLQLVRDRLGTFAISWTFVHNIDEQSPLLRSTPESLKASSSEVIVSMVGIDETFSQSVYARHTYSAGDIVWNARFVDIFSQLPDGTPSVDYGRFHDTVPLGKEA